MIVLENAVLAVTVQPLGAELTRLYNKTTGIDYLWSGDAAFWGKQSPVLFPIVGALKDNTAHHEGQAITLGRHGFAREKNFELVAHTPEKAIFKLVSTPDTLAVFPFPFECRLVYALQADTLAVSYELYNPSEAPLLCSIGGHPAFNVPLTADTVYDDYYLKFECAEPLNRYPLSTAGLLRTEMEKVADATTVLPLTKALFYKDALVFKHLRSKKISICSDKTAHGLEMEFEGFPYFGIWAAKDAPFVCLEPWCGIADSDDTTQVWAQKEGIETIAPRATWVRTWTVRPF